MDQLVYNPLILHLMLLDIRFTTDNVGTYQENSKVDNYYLLTPRPYLNLHK